MARPTIVQDINDDLGPDLIEMTAEQPPRGQAMVIAPEQLQMLSQIIFQPITAKRCEVVRTQSTVLMRIKEAAAMAADEFYYSFPVKNADGSRDYIEGISIDGAMAAMQAYGNCDVDCRPIDVGHGWIFLARFVDLERGTSYTRPFYQRKQGGSRLGGKDEGRRIEIAFSIGASKATRNVIANAIRPYTNFCEQEAKQDLVKRVGTKLPEQKARVLARLQEIGVDVTRVEAQFGRAVDDWTAREVAGAITQLRAIQQNLAVPNDFWPAPAPPEPRRSDPPPTDEKPAADAGTSTAAGAAAASSPPNQPAERPTPAGGSEPPSSSVTAPFATNGTPAPDLDLPPERRNWKIGDDVLGQDAFLKAIEDLLDMTASDAEQDELERANADRIAKVTGLKRSHLNAKFADKRRERQAKRDAQP